MALPESGISVSAWRALFLQIGGRHEQAMGNIAVSYRNNLYTFGYRRRIEMEFLYSVWEILWEGLLVRR